MEIDTDIISSMILGIVFAIFAYFLLGFNIIYKGTNSKIIIKKVYKVDDKCYMFEPVIHLCK